MATKKLVVFDLDGTLNKTELYSVPAHQKALRELCIYRDEETIISTFGERAVDAAKILLDSDDPYLIRWYFRRVEQYENDFIKQYAGEYEGVTPMLRTLKEKGYVTAVCSNAPESYIRMVLNRLDYMTLIDVIRPLEAGLTKDDTLGLLLEQEKPHAAVMVGDRVFDENAARANGIPFIGCAYGFQPHEVANARYRVSCPAEIVAAVAEAIGEPN